MALNPTPQTKRIIVEGIKNNREALNQWFCSRAKDFPPPFYCSVDLRDSGHKIVPVDSNLYPAGFNNICPDDLRTSPAIFRAQIDSLLKALGQPVPTKVLILPESHTSNRFYIENLYYLRQILIDAGYEVQIGWFGDVPEDAGTTGIALVSATDKKLTAFPIEIKESVLSAGGFTPDLILLNNDFSSGYPKELDGLKQPIFPSHTLGWHSRKKSEHFVHYNRLATEFAQVIGIDPWLITIDTEEVTPVNFNEGEGIEEVAKATERVLERTRAAYAQHKITTEPFAFIKNNHGTYGMGIMVVHSAEEVRTMNRRAKNKMSVGKNKLVINSVAVQEGVLTATLVDRLAAEPVIYMAGSELIGGFLRTNTERGAEENLNSQGMVFRMLCMLDLRRSGILGVTPDLDEELVEEEPTMEIVYGAIARISALATGAELAAHDPHGHGLLRGTWSSDGCRDEALRSETAIG